MPESSDVHRERTSYVQNSDAIRETILDMSLVFVSTATRCRCVGIRVEQEGDFPLIRSLGFSKGFVKREQSLLPESASAELDIKERLARLACLCGRVIRGERNGCEELFTDKGCLWLNDFSRTDKIPPAVREEMRTACLEEGFQSFALIPCFADSKSLALLHVCDKRRGLLSRKAVARLEESGEHLAKLFLQLRELKRASELGRTEPLNLRVLVVDDEQEIVNLVTEMLGAKGHRVTGTLSGAEALELLANQKTDIVIADFNMPEMSGLVLAIEIGRRWRPYAPPVILMSGTFTEEVLFRDKELSDVAAFLAKPFSVETLLDAIHTVTC